FHPALADYERGYVKEGVGAGGLAVLWQLSGRRPEDLAWACDQACRQLLADPVARAMVAREQGDRSDMATPCGSEDAPAAVETAGGSLTALGVLGQGMPSEGDGAAAGRASAMAPCGPGGA
ncbi:MAG: hypothetical protein VKI42_07085, partial [Synechococcaceae cyanobacterium]|nr:hypothetical protein [Synechococcaceae cyanobacterium]